MTRDGPGYLSYVPLRDGYLRRWKRGIRSEITTLCALSVEAKPFLWNKGELRRHNLNPALALYRHGESYRAIYSLSLAAIQQLDPSWKKFLKPRL